jgi:hypothetical protein
MTPTQGLSQQSHHGVESYEALALYLVYNFCSIFTLPVEMLLRPRFGSQYFPPMISMFSSIMMVLLPVFLIVADGISHMLPFGAFALPQGLFGIGSLSKLYFLGSFVHGIRVFRRMIHPFTERISTYEGPPLFIFRIIPASFFTIRIIFEPLFVIIVAVVLQNLFILQSSAGHFLEFSAVMLVMKEYTDWLICWKHMRGVLDVQAGAPIIAKFLDNTASQDELASINLASLPKDTPEDVRRQTAQHYARTFDPTGGRHD